MRSDSLSFSNIKPGATDVVLWYSFEYDHELHINDTITIFLPNWSGSGTAINNLCQQTTFSVSLSNHGQPTCQLILTVTKNNLAASKFCRLSIGGLENPTLLFERNSDSFRHSVDSVNVKMTSTRVSESTSISGGAFTGDSMTFTNTGSMSAMSYYTTFHMIKT